MKVISIGKLQRGDHVMISYLGIDPGISGGFAVVSGDKILYKMVMPTLSFTTKAGKTKTELDREGILSFLATLPEVPSDVWQSHFGIFPANRAGGKSTKEQAFDIARMIFPDEDFKKSERAHKPHDGVVDATLIAKYCQSLFSREMEK
jgi:hypothetical protein